MSPKLSIILTCYNLGAYLKEAVDSVMTYKEQDNVQLIIVNDGSTEKLTLDVLNKIDLEYKNVIILSQENQGLAMARNNGINLAKGNYIIPLDADNKIRHGFINDAIKILDEEDHIDMVHGNAEFFGKREGIWKVKPFEISEMVLNNYIDACACFRKSVWERLSGYDTNMPVMGFEDWDFWLRMHRNGFSFKYIDKVFFDYRVREKSMISNAWEHRNDLISYIFDKEELHHYKVLRDTLIENRKLK
ncbi:MAG: glycosyltransferase family A protein [Winogradskyella sp.]